VNNISTASAAAAILPGSHSGWTLCCCRMQA
jgi:hypothetical protein